MAEINWTYEAETWLKDIYDYIAADNPDAAARTMGFMRKPNCSNSTPKLDINTTPSPPAPCEFSFTATTESPIKLRPMATSIIPGVFHGALDIDRYLV